MRLICVSFFSLAVFYAQSIYANDERRFQVDIQGLHYQAVVTENTHIAAKVMGVDEEVVGHHFVGQLEGEESSWVRASLIDGKWQGVISVHNAMHIIQHIGGTVPSGAAAVTNAIMASACE